MLERELREMTHVPRWGIVRTIRQQFLSDHTAMVAVYANDLAVYLGLDLEDIGIILQLALWHDFKEEIFSGDITGPCKRAGMNNEARSTWDRALHGMASRVFSSMGTRDGSEWAKPLHHVIVKLADMLDECSEMGIEISMGNRNVVGIFDDSLQRVENAVEAVAMEMGWPVPGDDVPLDPEKYRDHAKLRGMCVNCCNSAQHGVSRNTKFETI